MKCVLIADGVIAAVSECFGLPTNSGWRKAYPNEVYKIGESVDMFDSYMRRKPVDVPPVYDRTDEEAKKALAQAAAEEAARQLIPQPKTGKTEAETAKKATGKKGK